MSSAKCTSPGLCQRQEGRPNRRGNPVWLPSVGCGCGRGQPHRVAPRGPDLHTALVSGQGLLIVRSKPQACGFCYPELDTKGSDPSQAQDDTLGGVPWAVWRGEAQ